MDEPEQFHIHGDREGDADNYIIGRSWGASRYKEIDHRAPKDRTTIFYNDEG